VNSAYHFLRFKFKQQISFNDMTWVVIASNFYLEQSFAHWKPLPSTQDAK